MPGAGGHVVDGAAGRIGWGRCLQGLKPSNKTGQRGSIIPSTRRRRGKRVRKQLLRVLPQPSWLRGGHPWL